MPSQSGYIRTAQAATLLLATTAGAMNLSLSLFVIPRLLESPTPLMIQQWSNMVARTSRIFPPAIWGSGVCFYYLAYTTSSRLFAAAGTLCAAATPWTWRFIIGINKQLHRKAAEMKTAGADFTMSKEEELGAKSLVDQWGLYNLGRGSLVLTAGILGLYATLS
jgi:hypothetical protein